VAPNTTGMFPRLLSRHAHRSAVRRTALLVVVALSLAAFNEISSAASTIADPSHDGFYRYTGRAPLSQIAPGTPLRERNVTLAAMTTGTPLPAQQILYRTTDSAGHPALSVTTVVLPATGTAAPRVVGYLSFYDALGPKCDPSFTLRGGDPGAPNQNTAGAEQAVAYNLHAQGYIVTVPDIETETLDFGAGPAYGRSSLDAIKATLAVLKLAASTPVGLMGYSGGSIASDWASELAPRYAPTLNVVGVAQGGMPVDFAHILKYVDGTPKWSAVMPAAVVGIARSYHVDIAPYLSDFGAKIVRADSDKCIAEFTGNLTLKQLLKPQYADVLHVPALRRLFDATRMGSVPGHPVGPLLMVAGNVDGTGDGITIAADQKALAAQYCKQGVAVAYAEVPHGEHTQVGVAFMPQAFAFLAARFAGLPPASNCASLGAAASVATGSSETSRARVGVLSGV
jgi:hypothetical protein